MSLPKPMLDNRTFTQLVAEGTTQINRLSPGWTNYNAADPGITLIELFAWLSEQNLYRTDRVTDEMVRTFLRLVDITPAPPGVAETVVLLATTTTAAGVPLPDRVQLADPLGAIVFETREALTVSTAHLAQVLAAGDPPVDVTAANLAPFDREPGRDRRQLPAVRCRAAARSGVLSRLRRGARTRRRAGVALRLDDHPRAGRRNARGAAARACGADRRRRARLPTRARRAGLRLAAALRSANHLGVPRRRRIVAADPRGRGRDARAHPQRLRPLPRAGRARAGRPPSGGSGPLWFIRCRILAGTFECATRLDRVGVNAVAAEHAASIDAPELIGTSLGHATEIYDTAANPVVAGSTRLSLALGAQHDDRWTETPQWDLVGPHDRRYRLQPELGRITTGNGMRGAVLPAGWDLLLDYRVGGGVEGNIVAGTLAGLAASAWNIARIPGEAAVAAALTVTQPVAAIGGSEAEALAAAEARAVAALSAPTRAVTLGDVVALARAVPGVPVARAKALPNTHPAVPCFTAPGSITIIVVPDCPGVAPMPGDGFLRAVARFLDRRRPVTTELHVIAPTYVTVTVAATLQVSSRPTRRHFPRWRKRRWTACSIRCRAVPKAPAGRSAARSTAPR